MFMNEMTTTISIDTVLEILQQNIQISITLTDCVSNKIDNSDWDKIRHHLIEAMKVLKPTESIEDVFNYKTYSRGY
jgi:hypothetical protein